MDIYENINEENLTGDLSMLSDVCGIVNVRKILRHLGGISLYIPKISRLDGFVVDYIKNNQTKSIKKIAGELGVSEQYIRNVKRREKIR